MNINYGYLKDDYLELANECPVTIGSKPVYTAEMIFKLRDMAEKNVYPDIRFSDEEYEIWSAFYLLYSKES